MAPARKENLPAEAEQATGAGSFARDLTTSETQYSAGFHRIFCAPPELELDREVLLERVHPDDRELIDESLELAWRKRRPFSFEVRVRRFDDADAVIRVRGKLALGDDGQPRRLIGTIQDITEDARERSARELLSYVVDSSDDAIITKQRDGTITTWNRGAERLYGWTAEEAIGQPIGLIDPVERAGEQREILQRVFGGESVDHFETERIRKDGTRLVVSLTVSPVRDGHGEIVSAAIIARDITERTRYEERLRHLADHDQLTGLFNRRRFDEELKRELARAGRYHSHGAVLSIDIDNFKSINDSAGHAAGDAVLSEVAGVLERRLRASDIVARIGGDEFAALLPSADVDEARTAAEDLLASIHGSKAVFGGKPLRITSSIGVAAFESDDATAGELLTGADLAMYAAKAQGRDRVVVYTASEGRRARATLKLTWAERIREALRREHGFVLHLQPILDLATGKISHGELLLRMRGEHGDLIPPGAFLPAAERYGLIHAVDRWVVSRAIQMLAATSDVPPPALGVNLSGESVVGDPQLLNLIERELWASSVDPAKLIFEITETAAIANMPEASAFAKAVNELGASLALDDFGTGFGSFYYLKHLPVSYLKLDGEFIQNLPRSEVDAHMVSAIVRVAQSMGIKTVAESVTDDETIRLLREHGVDFAQGFHVGRPGPIAEPSSN
ncbi:MAG TPA: EAL domain-containing protein [Solirubrobacteraceae bacterium]|nr:EAL domain-containing protein [Solirubrobacteraceae bacterium]